MNSTTVIREIMILFIIMLIGFIAKKRNIVNENIQSSISTLLMKIAMPALVLSSSRIQKESGILPNIISIFIITAISYLFFIAFCYGITRILNLKKSSANVFSSLIVFANVGFMGYPIANAVFGSIGVFYTSIVNLVFSLFLWTYGIMLYNSKDKIDFKNLLNIGTISAVTAVILFIANIKLPYSIHTALEITGRTTTPLSMILIGALISNVKIKSIISDWKIFAVSFIRLLLAPLLTTVILSALNFNSTVISICAVMAAMPAAATNAIFANEYDCEPSFASIGVFVTTLFSIITIPFIIFLLINLFNIF